MGWYVAGSLNRLLAQLNAKAPKRSKASDGSIGDAAHSARYSDHNPTSAGQVCARDFTHDPAGGLDCNWLAESLVASRDPRIKYVIWNRRILDSRPGNNPWRWMPYSGSNAHTKHLHVSVFAGKSGDNAADWSLSGAPSGGGTTPPAPNPTPAQEDEDDEVSYYPKELPVSMKESGVTLPWDGRAAVLNVASTGTVVFVGKPLNWGPRGGTGGGDTTVPGVNPSRVEVNQPGQYYIPAGTTRIYYRWSCATPHFVWVKAA